RYFKYISVRSFILNGAPFQKPLRSLGFRLFMTFAEFIAQLGWHGLRHNRRRVREAPRGGFGWQASARRGSPFPVLGSYRLRTLLQHGPGPWR
ncbi:MULTISPECIES: hypothetical protein, partial [Hyphomicrobiales]|uniref:hypothetical protein n=1 Tax=Methylobacterium sp. CCH7-A2 TaxID=1768789 RepID=UPI001AED0E8D